MTTAGYMQWMSNDIGFAFVVPSSMTPEQKQRKKIGHIKSELRIQLQVRE